MPPKASTSLNADLVRMFGDVGCFCFRAFVSIQCQCCRMQIVDSVEVLSGPVVCDDRFDTPTSYATRRPLDDHHTRLSARCHFALLEPVAGGTQRPDLRPGAAPQPLLVQLTQHLDCTPLEQACATYQHTAGPGNYATHTVPRLVRALLVKYLRNLSLRELEDDIRTNLASKWFVGYSPFEAGPDHSTLERFEQWVIAHQARTFFDAVLRQIDQDLPAERQQPQIGDTYALRANAAQETLITRLRHTCRSLLGALAAADAAGHTALLADLDPAALFGGTTRSRNIA